MYQKYVKGYFKKNWFRLILILIFFISLFYINPVQKELYLKEDFELLKTKSNLISVCILIIGLVVILYFTLRGVANLKEAGNVLFGVTWISISLYIVLHTIVLSLTLLLNRVFVLNKVEKKYGIAFFLETPKHNHTAVIYDFATKESLLFENITGIGKLKNRNVKDTVILSFDKGLLGFKFNPEVK